MPENTSQIASTVTGLQREFSIIAHNLANVNTVGYKRRCNSFSRSLSMDGDGGDKDVENNIDLVTCLDLSQGNLVNTGRSLDFALTGRGFFVVETPDGPLYTRNGIFRLDENGRLVDSSGRLVEGEAGPISVPKTVGPGQISVSSEGIIRAGGAIIGTLRVVDFGEDQSKLVPAGDSCLSAPQGVKARDAENVVVKQGFQEASNVKMVEELVDMIMVSRLYEANMQFMTAQKDTSKSILDVAMS